MSFITKRERVFNDYELFDLPSRNEGKLKAYASCTDARAWSHFGSDKTEHLMEVIKKNNETCRVKYLPTDVIVDTLMLTKNKEIARLKRKIEEFERLVSAYDQLDLTCDQKCEIANAHASIRAAYRDLEDLSLDLDLSGFTEGIDSEGFETGKSRGDEPRQEMQKRVTACKSAQVEQQCGCDVSTSAHDERIQEMQDALIDKDARMSAMQNTIAVMENDVCEPYCIYAHIYTALEKIFGTLCQNDRYKLYLTLLTSGKDTRCIDIKGKILFKLKVLEKFSLALISPCSQEFANANNQACFCAQVMRVETAFALTSTESKKPSLDNKRAQLVADIMENEEMKEILSKDDSFNKFGEDTTNTTIDDILIENYSLDTENLNRLKNLQVNYDELVNCYENLKHERDCLKIRSQKYEEAEKELESLRNQLREYDLLWKEKEHYRKRSEDIDSLKEQYLVLSDETMNLETQLKAETEINYLKANTIEELRHENIALEQKINDLTIAFEKENNYLQCKLKEAECTVMCQEQQIKSLSAQIDKILDQDRDKVQDKENIMSNSVVLIDEMESLKDEMTALKEALCCSEEEKQQLQEQFQDNLKLINELKMEIEDWKSSYEKTLQRNDYLEKYTESFRDEVHKLIEENRVLSQDVEDKSTAVGNLINVVHNKSQEVNNLMNEIERKNLENNNLLKQFNDLKKKYDESLIILENEKKEAFQTIQLARQESHELLEKVKDYDEMVHKTFDMSKSLEEQAEDYNKIRDLLMNTIEDNKRLQMDLVSHENNNAILLQEIQRLREVNSYAVESLNNLKDENNQYKMSLDLTKKESEILEERLNQFSNIRGQLNELRQSQEKLLQDKTKLEIELQHKVNELDQAFNSFELTRKESEDLMKKLQSSENLNGDLMKLNDKYKTLLNDKQLLQKHLDDKSKDLENIISTLNNLRTENEQLMQKSKRVDDLERELIKLKKAYDDLATEKNTLQRDFDNKTEEINHLCNTLESKIEENRELASQMKSLHSQQMESQNNMATLQNEKMSAQRSFESLKRESKELIDKIKQYDHLVDEFAELKRIHDQTKLEKEKLQGELERQFIELQRVEQENREINSLGQNLMAHNEDLEKALINARNEIITSSPSQTPYIDVLKEIEQMKKEKLVNNKKIRDLLDKLDESENVISNLSEEVLARDDKIAILENHINSLEDEVRRLHRNLAELVDTSEQIKENSSKKIDQSLNKIEAHHSRANHNMKMELAKLQSENSKLEEQLSVTKLKSDESFRDKHKYVSQIIHLQNEREIIVTDIKQLELAGVGDSALMPDKCNTEDILNSLDRIRKSLEAKQSKSSSLEHTLLKVQTSSQLLLSKADEAKKLVEKEKQKIYKEKEEAIADKLNMEKQLSELKEKLENQATADKALIKDLEGEILNQKLIIDKINKSTQNYIGKLEEEMQSLQTLYQNSITKVSDLQDKLQKLSEENGNNINIIEKVNLELEKKSKDIADLQTKLQACKEKSNKDHGVQASISPNNKNEKIQTDKYNFEYNVDNGNMDSKMAEVTIHRKHKSQPLNEVQILAANVGPTFDFVRNSYLDYKIPRLQKGRLEQYSVSGMHDTADSNGKESPLKVNVYSHSADEVSQTPHFIDIYNKRSVNTESSKGNDLIDEETGTITVKDPQSATKSSGFTEFGNNVFESEDNINNNKNQKGGYFLTSTEDSNEKDLFLIYKDSEKSHTGKQNEDKEIWNSNAQPEILVERMTIQPPQQKTPKIYTPIKQHKRTPKQNDIYERNVENYKNDGLKQKIDIELPRVQVDSQSNVSVSDGDKKSSESYTVTLFTSQKPDDVIKDLNGSSKYGTQEKTLNLTDKSSIKEILKTNTEKNKLPYQRNLNNDTDMPNSGYETHQQNKLKQQDPENSDTNYKLKIVGDMDFENIERHKKLNRSRSVDVMINFRDSLTIDSSQFKVFADSVSASSGKSQQKSVNEQSVMVNTDGEQYYEEKIRRLTDTLQNIEKDYKKKIDAIKIQYDNNIKNIINEHNQGVKSIQSLHEETLQDILKLHENEVENLRTMSIEAMRKAEKLEKENRLLKNKFQDSSGFDDEPTKIISTEVKKRKCKCRGDTKMLTKTNVEAFNVKPKLRSHGPCTCSLDVNVSDTIRNIFEQVDVEQRKMAEHAYLKYIANKMITGGVEVLDAQELSFLHLKVCRTWKFTLSKEEALQKKIDTLETELLSKQRYAQQHIADLDRKVAEERRRLHEVREAVCRSSPNDSRTVSTVQEPPPSPPPPPPTLAEKDFSCKSGTGISVDVSERRSAGDLLQQEFSVSGIPPRRFKTESNRAGNRGRLLSPTKAVLANLDVEERRERRLAGLDDPPTRLRRAHDRHAGRHYKK